jgi:Mn2+/Fe2+ NRAMP family transporter
VKASEIPDMEQNTKGKIFLGKLPPLIIKSMPPFMGIAAAMGPGVIWAALAQGSGELIWWPYLTAKYGAAFLGLLLPAALMQYFVNQEVVRYTVTTGETFFTGMARVGKVFSGLLWIMLVVTFLWFGGYASSGATALRELFGWPTAPRMGTLFWAYLTIAVFAGTIFLGPVVYNIIERFMTIIVAITIGGLIVAVLNPTVLATASSFFSAYLNPGHFFTHGLPPDFEQEDLNTLLTAIAFAGMGGFFNAMYSYWVRDKGHGMARYIGRITSPVTGKPETILATGFGFEHTEENRRHYRDWIRFMRLDNLFGVLTNLLTVTLMVWLAWALLLPKREYPSGWNLAVVQAAFFENSMGSIGRAVFLLVAAAFLADSWLAITDAVARMHADFFFATFPKTQRWSFRTWYYLFVIILILITAATMLMAEPGTLLILGGVLNFFAMAIYMPFLIHLNYFMVPRSLPAWTRPKTLTLVVTALVSLTYLVIAVLYVLMNFG